MTAIRAAFKAYRMHQVLIMPRFARLTIALGLATAVFPVDAEYYFNPRFLSNDLAESVDLSAFTKGREAPPGTYRVDIYLNDEFMTSRDITFIADDNNAELIPCLSTDLLVSLGIKKSALLDNKEHSAEKHVPDNSACTPLQDRLADASTEFDVGQQHLSLSVPQIYVGRMARGYVSPDLWEEGINAGLLNYSFNGNSINNRSNHNAGKSNYAYLNLQSGINIGSWRLRDNSTWSYNSGSSNSSDSNKWQHINTSAERDIIPLRSRLTVGDSYTDGDIFDSVNFRGLKINSTVYWNNVTYPFPLTTNTNVLDIGDKTPMPLPLKLYITPVGAAGGVVIKAGEVIARIHMYKIATLGSGNPRNFTWNIISNNSVVMPTGGCTVDSRNVTVDLPDFPGSAEIPLGVYCSSEQKLSFYLSGATTDSARQVFANTAPDATKASGVGVSLMRNGKILATGENVSLGTVNKSKVPLGLSATYGQTGNKVSAGTVQSVIGVTFIYE
ncbi:TPA: fimbrial protein [Escherichia coli]|nr:fimbrial protein [Escherichia coli]